MPLHLLGKKSWNVYNTDNIEKVKRDEAAAAAREAAEEQRMQEVDAERRIQILRGLRVEQLPAADNEQHAESGRRGSGREPKRRRIAGEDDTDRDIRLAKEADTTSAAKAGALVTTRTTSDAPLTDHAGHINLFPMESSRRNGPKNAEAEAETARKKRELEDQYTMRFSNAAGFKQAIGQKPWYHALDAVSAENQDQTPSKDVWGNEDPRRKEREKMRMAADDPLAAIQKGVTELREVERERKRWKEQKERELMDLYQAERAKSRQRKRHRGSMGTIGKSVIPVTVIAIAIKVAAEVAIGRIFTATTARAYTIIGVRTMIDPTERVKVRLASNQIVKHRQHLPKILWACYGRSGMSVKARGIPERLHCC
ncbi:MAG: hypothetical protein FRX48_01324 [Lasallia pustulata]|uniref:CBF1-interacting co-repressor CIR N-terminal domain-containing protein n=1 Tax=Lasallia pustulata TaxID=136370 RepID=A0A5M8PZM5_9LECA|nr:MAG: hypothetical protein FRX48_01324 [Lasallia pustulata]